MQQLTVPALNSAIRACLGAEDFDDLDESTLDSDWNALGLDSLAVYELVTRLQEDLGVSISDEDIDTFKTPRLLVSMINERFLGPAVS